MKILTVFFFTIFNLNIAFAQHTNVMIGNTNSPEEPSIMLNPKNPRYIVAGANIRWSYYSSDTGRTWTGFQLSNPVYGVYGDPTIICDTSGDFYFFHLSDPPGSAFIDQIVCQKSVSNGESWNTGTGIGLNGTKAQDKQWAVVDPGNNNIYITWTQFDKYGSTLPTDSSHILFSRSTDGGTTWSSAKRINEKGGDCIDDDNTVEGAVPAVGPNGEIYVTWAGPLGLVFDKSTDGGNTWMDNDKIIAPIPGGWNYNIPGISRANGLPVTACDLSNGTNRGTIYVNWSDQRNGGFDTDIWLTKSIDGGITWSTPIKVNDDAAGKQQFLTWMTIDQSNGYLYFVFYDRRNYNDNRTDVYMARSKDGGASFQNFKISASPFAPVSSIFFGDYSNITAYKGIIRPIWTRMDNGILSVWTALTDTSLIPGAVVTSVINPDVNIEYIKSYPNPFTNNSYLSFKMRRAGLVTVQLFDITGRLTSTPIEKRFYTTGKYTEHIDIGKLNLLAGIYFYRIMINDKLYTQKIILLE
jgi:Secretion system C-terminal sorting domain